MEEQQRKRPTNTRSAGQDDGTNKTRAIISKDGHWETVRIRNHSIRQPREPNDTDGPNTDKSNSTDVENQGEIDVDLESSDQETVRQQQSCEAIDMVDRLALEISWSQEIRGCCKECKANVGSAKYQHDRLKAIICARHGGA